jgi:hypothetical protein
MIGKVFYVEANETSLANSNFIRSRFVFVLKEADLEYAYGWNRYTMTFMGIWPEERNFAQISSYKAMIPILMMFCFVCAPQSTNLLFIWGDFDLIIENLSMGNITITISMLKSIVFWLNGGCKYINLYKIIDCVNLSYASFSAIGS